MVSPFALPEEEKRISDIDRLPPSILEGFTASGTVGTPEAPPQMTGGYLEDTVALPPEENEKVKAYLASIGQLPADSSSDGGMSVGGFAQEVTEGVLPTKFGGAAGLAAMGGAAALGAPALAAGAIGGGVALGTAYLIRQIQDYALEKGDAEQTGIWTAIGDVALPYGLSKVFGKGTSYAAKEVAKKTRTPLKLSHILHKDSVKAGVVESTERAVAQMSGRDALPAGGRVIAEEFEKGARLATRSGVLQRTVGKGLPDSLADIQKLASQNGDVLKEYSKEIARQTDLAAKVVKLQGGGIEAIEAARESLAEGVAQIGGALKGLSPQAADEMGPILKKEIQESVSYVSELLTNPKGLTVQGAMEQIGKHSKIVHSLRGYEGKAVFGDSGAYVDFFKKSSDALRNFVAERTAQVAKQVKASPELAKRFSADWVEQEAETVGARNAAEAMVRASNYYELSNSIKGAQVVVDKAIKDELIEGSVDKSVFRTMRDAIVNIFGAKKPTGADIEKMMVENFSKPFQQPEPYQQAMETGLGKLASSTRSVPGYAPIASALGQEYGPELAPEMAFAEGMPTPTPPPSDAPPYVDPVLSGEVMPGASPIPMGSPMPGVLDQGMIDPLMPPVEATMPSPSPEPPAPLPRDRAGVFSTPPEALEGLLPPDAVKKLQDAALMPEPMQNMAIVEVMQGSPEAFAPPEHPWLQGYSVVNNAIIDPQEIGTFSGYIQEKVKRKEISQTQATKIKAALHEARPVTELLMEAYQPPKTENFEGDESPSEPGKGGQPKKSYDF